MKVILDFECEHCIEDLSLEFSISGKHLPTMHEVRTEADKVGWKIGARVFCPTCYAKLPAHCDTCEHYEGNKTMGAPYCRKRKCFVCSTDYCEDHNSFLETDKPVGVNPSVVPQKKTGSCGDCKDCLCSSCIENQSISAVGRCAGCECCGEEDITCLVAGNSTTLKIKNGGEK